MIDLAAVAVTSQLSLGCLHARRIVVEQAQARRPRAWIDLRPGRRAARRASRPPRRWRCGPGCRRPCRREPVGAARGSRTCGVSGRQLSRVLLVDVQQLLERAERQRDAALARRRVGLRKKRPRRSTGPCSTVMSDERGGTVARPRADGAGGLAAGCAGSGSLARSLLSLASYAFSRNRESLMHLSPFWSRH